MQRKEIMAFSVFGFLFTFSQLVEHYFQMKVSVLAKPFGNHSIPENISQQIHVFLKYGNIAGVTFRILTVFFLLYVGWKVAYGFLDLRYVIIWTIGVFVFSALLSYLFRPDAWAIWRDLAQNLIFSAAWIGIMKIYHVAAQKMQLKK
ncbi:hypothetical protein [Caproiciproducens sp. CPB-2]|uniref:hypothetical protein n=1 Tax=Caproiciproducens sp. CPB-2 TaxID=3030017 RepID=UPI0023D99741|nr:hypothetical protein [Caproiciproducens sp. CPB-2]MDF1496091.1 hypothetical protein [Caproiciproducens sp. CPB-2]